MTSPPHHQLRQVLRKYQTLLDLRIKREKQEKQGIPFSARQLQSRKKQMAALARIFPGALRELDTLSAVKIRQRILDIQNALDAPRKPTSPWIPLVLDFHQAVREALDVKMWLARHPQADSKAQRLKQLQRWHTTKTWRFFPDMEQKQLQTFLRLPQGRLLNLVWPMLEQKYGLGVPELRDLLFGRRCTCDRVGTNRPIGR